MAPWLVCATVTVVDPLVVVNGDDKLPVDR